MCPVEEGNISFGFYFRLGFALPSLVSVCYKGGVGILTVQGRHDEIIPTYESESLAHAWICISGLLFCSYGGPLSPAITGMC